MQGVGVFKASAVRLVLDEGKTVGAAARDLDLTETALREWVKRADAPASKNARLTFGSSIAVNMITFVSGSRA